MIDKLFNETCGMFNALHYITIALFFAILALLLFVSRKMTHKQANRLLTVISILVPIAEVVKIFLRIDRGLGPDSWVPLYYCSLFLFAIIAIRVPVRSVQRAGYAYMSMGGILSSMLFTFYPSTSLGMYPLLSSATIHSFMFHLVMCYSGFIVLTKTDYIPTKKDSLNYFIFILIACLAGLICNRFLGTNCMFLEHPFGLPILQPIVELSPILYMSIVILAQSSAIYWANYGLYHLATRKRVP